MYIGVDFGTSFSQAATLEFTQPVLLEDAREYGTPSVFYYDHENGIGVGTEALECSQGYSSVNLKTDIKMDLLENKSVTVDDRTFSCEEIISEICKHVLTKSKRIASTRGIDPEIKGMVITVPAKFGYLEKDIIARSISKALGEPPIPVTGILKEPVAAALHYFQTNVEDGKNILVFDLGGGTCDIALVRAKSSSRDYYEVIDSEMERIGGRDWDAKITGRLIEVFEEQTGITISNNPSFQRKILEAANSAKHRLSNQDKAICRVEFDTGLRSYRLTLDEFDSLTSGLLDQAVDALKRVYHRNISDCEIDDIICVGGSSNMQQIKRRIEQEFPLCKVRIHHPEYAVVYGAALYADMRKDKVYEDIPEKHSNVIDRADFSYGIQVVDNKGTPQEKYRIQNMILQNTVLPAVSNRLYRPSEDNMEAIVFRVYETDTKEDHCDMDKYPMTKIGELKLVLPPNTPMTTDFPSQLTLNQNGILEIKAWDIDGNALHAEFNVMHNS